MLDIDPLRDGPTPTAASTVIPLRMRDGEVEVFLLQRHRATAFMGGAYVFPGGKLDEADASAEVLARVEGPPREEAHARLGPHEAETSTTTALALFVAAARETFEEAGLFLGRPGPSASCTLAEARAALLAGTSFATVLAHLDATLTLDRLVPAARWITPAVEKRRFDARFFVCAMAPGEHVAMDAQETVSELWATPRRAVAMHDEGSIDLPPPTLRTLELLRDARSVEDVLREARATTPPLVRPVFRPLEPWILALPGDPEHPEAARVLGGPTRFERRGVRWFSATGSHD